MVPAALLASVLVEMEALPVLAAGGSASVSLIASALLPPACWAVHATHAAAALAAGDVRRTADDLHVKTFANQTGLQLLVRTAALAAGMDARWPRDCHAGEVVHQTWSKVSWGHDEVSLNMRCKNGQLALSLENKSG